MKNTLLLLKTCIILTSLIVGYFLLSPLVVKVQASTCPRPNSDASTLWDNTGNKCWSWGGHGWNTDEQYQACGPVKCPDGTGSGSNGNTCVTASCHAGYGSIGFDAPGCTPENGGVSIICPASDDFWVKVVDPSGKGLSNIGIAFHYEDNPGFDNNGKDKTLFTDSSGYIKLSGNCDDCSMSGITSFLYAGDHVTLTPVTAGYTYNPAKIGDQNNWKVHNGGANLTISSTWSCGTLVEAVTTTTPYKTAHEAYQQIPCKFVATSTSATPTSTPTPTTPTPTPKPPTPTPAASNDCPCFIKGDVYVDVDQNGFEWEISEGGPDYAYTTIPQPQLHLTGNGKNITLSAGTNGVSAGNYQFTALPKGTYTIDLVAPPGGYNRLYPPGPVSVTVGPNCSPNGVHDAQCDTQQNITELDFGFIPAPTDTPTPLPLYSVSGVNFIDKNNDTRYQPLTDSVYSGGGQVVNISDGVNTNIDIPIQTDGTYTSGTVLPAGSYTASYTPPLPAGYFMTEPVNGPPPSFSIALGNGQCSGGSSPDGTCANGNLSSLNFGINNTAPWFQSFCGDVRQDNGIYDPIPLNPVCGGGSPQPYVISSAAVCNNKPGVVYTGGTTANFGTNGGQASVPNYLAGGTIPEIYSPNNLSIIRTSYDYMYNTAKQSGITPTNITTIPGCASLANCSLPNNAALFPHGVYIANGDLYLNPLTVPNGNNYVLLVNGDLYIQGNITMPPASNSTFTVSGNNNIYVHQGVGNTSPTDSTVNIAGLFSADRSFVVRHKTGGNCASGVVDRRLNIEGSIVVNAGNTGGTFQNNRDLCISNASCPAVTFNTRPDLIINSPSFIKHKASTFQELAP